MVFSSPVNPLVVVVPIEELHLLEGPGAGQVADDGRMHQKKQIQSRCSWCQEGASERRQEYYISGSFAQKVTFNSSKSQSDLLKVSEVHFM